MSGLSACGAGSDGNTLVWYINPDSGGQDAVAKACSTDDYTIETQVLPQDAGQQRIQLARRLAAEDPGIDLMSIDPPYTAEFANAGFLAPIPDADQEEIKTTAFQGAVDAATWDGNVVVYPFWSNVQVLWYRKSFVAGTDLEAPLAAKEFVTWDQIIDAAAAKDAQIGVQANKYEGYVVWLNALISGAGGTIAENADKGLDVDITIDSPEGETAAKIVEKLSSEAAAPDLSVSNEGTAATTYGGDKGSFMVNWTYIFHNYDKAAPDVAKDIGYAPYPASTEGKESAPPYGGIGIGVSKYSTHTEEAIEAAKCLTSAESQGINAVKTGNMPASTGGYDYPELKEIYPADLLQLWQDSLDRAAPRTLSPYWSDISGAIQSIWHSPKSVNSKTPAESKKFIEDVLAGRSLL